jgi:hypothetical protein
MEHNGNYVFMKRLEHGDVLKQRRISTYCFRMKAKKKKLFMGIKNSGE